MADGYDKETAIAICYTSIVEGRALEEDYSWDQCIADQKKRGYSQERAEKICGAIKAKDGESQRRIEYLEATIRPRGPDFQGREWDVTIIGAETPADIVMVDGQEYIRSKNGRFYLCEGLRDSVPQWDGIKVYDNHLTDAEFEQRAGMRSVRTEWLGAIVQPRWDGSKRKLRGILKVSDRVLAGKLKDAHDVDILDTIGLSIDTIPKGREATIEGKRQPVISGFKKIFSVDLVTDPAAGGGFNRLIAATQQEAKMALTEEMINEIRALIKEALAANQGQEQVEPEEAIEEVVAAAEEAAEDAPPEASPADVAQAAAHAAQVAADEIVAEEEPSALEAVRRLECKIALRDQLDAAKLAADARQVVEQAFAGKTFDLEESKRMIENVKTVVAARDGSGRIQGAGPSAPISVGMDESDWRAVEFLRLVAGNSLYRSLESIKDDYVQERLPESYKAWTKGGRVRGTTRRLSEWVYNAFGDPFAQNSRFYEAATTSTMSSIVKNAVNVILAADFQARHQWWDPLVRTEEVDTIDAATLVRVFGLGILSVVDEGHAYTELSWVDEEETAAFVKKGNYVGITMETLLRDKVNKVRAIPQLLADSWYNTLSALVGGVFTVNTHAGPLLVGSPGNLFNATATTTSGGHANLLTAALSYTSFDAAATALMKQQAGDQGTGAKLLVEPKFLLVPVDLRAQALQIRNSEDIPGSANNDPNPYYQTFEVVVVPDWTDVDNWAIVGNKERFPAIWLLFYRGNRVPELYTSDNETRGAMFTNDTLRYKVRMLTYRYSSTYDCAPVSDFRPLHKNNVS